MKKNFFAVCSLAVAAGLALLTPMSVSAASTEMQDGVSVKIVSDADTYAAGEDINLRINVANMNAFDVEDVDVSLSLPKELVLKLDELPAEKLRLKPGEKIDISAIASKQESTTTTGSNTAAVTTASNERVNSPRTGVDSISWIAIALVLFAGLAVYLAKKGKINKKTFSLLLALILTFYALPANELTYAVETGEIISNVIDVDLGITANGTDLKIAASVAYSFNKQLAEKATTDTDEDGLADDLETTLGTDATKKDTDNDGLTDAFEFNYLPTDPTIADTDGNSISDFDEDYDGDGLSNGKEQELGTRPDKADTDRDGLSDAEEVNKYKTDPTKVDTDGDGLTDYEEIKLGLDPNSASTDGKTPDAERKIHQTISEGAKSEALTNSDNWLIPSISGDVSGLIDYNVSLDKDTTTTFAENRSVLSDVVAYRSAYDTPVTLTFTFDPAYTEDTKNVAIIRFDNEDIKLLESAMDKENHTISAEITGDAYYFVMNVDEFLKGIGIDVLAETEKPAEEAAKTESGEAAAEPLANGTSMDAAENQQEAQEPPVVTAEASLPALLDDGVSASDTAGATFGQSDIIFVVDTTGSMSGAINNVRTNINTFANTLSKDYKVNVNYSLIEYRDINVDGVDSTKQHKSLSSNWFTNVEDFKSEINALSVSGGGDIPETPIDALEMARKATWRSGSTKYVVLVTDASYKNDNTKEITDMAEMADKFAKDGIIVSAIAQFEDTYSGLTSKTDGLYGYIYGNFSDILLGLAKKVGKETNEGGDWILLSDFSAVQLKDSVDKISSTDSDGDGLKDSEEIYNKHERNISSFIQSVLESADVPYEWYKGRDTITMWDFYSNPVLPDTDFDGLDDDVDPIKRPNSTSTHNEFKGTFHWKEDGDMKTTANKVELKMDYRQLLSDNTTYKKALSVFSILAASDAYKNTWVSWTDGTTGGSDEGGSLLKQFGCDDIVDTDVNSTDGLDTDDVTEVVIGHRNVVTINGSTEVVIVEVRGTNGTSAEWSSNFDVGADTDAYYGMTGEHPDWTNKENHKGFDVAANRAMRIIQDYLEEHEIDGGSILITGHSRGAAIADLIGAKFHDDSNFLSFTYGFATPNCTTTADSARYDSIFNVVNDDDLVPTLPLNAWGFHKYGSVKNISVHDHYENHWGGRQEGTWEWLIGGMGEYDDINSGVFRRTLDAFGEIATVRDDLYVLDSTSDGTVWENNLGHTTHNGAVSEKETLSKELQDEKLLKYCNLSIVGGGFLTPYHVEINYCPAYFMQVLANMTTKVGPLLGRDVKGKYVTAKRLFVEASGKVSVIGIPVGSITGGMQDTHEPVTYYLIAHNNFVDHV